MKISILIVALLSFFYTVQVQAFGNINSPKKSSINSYQPFSGAKSPFSNNTPTMRAIDIGDQGDDFLSGTGGEDHMGNTNDNAVPAYDGLWLVILLTLGYATVKRIKLQRKK